MYYRVSKEKVFFIKNKENSWSLVSQIPSEVYVGSPIFYHKSTLVISAINSNDPEPSTVFLLDRDGDDWKIKEVISPSDSERQDNFGVSLFLN